MRSRSGSRSGCTFARRCAPSAGGGGGTSQAAGCGAGSGGRTGRATKGSLSAPWPPCLVTAHRTIST
eukprot:8801519-Alexandrium_andersonii.AAC.1